MKRFRCAALLVACLLAWPVPAQAAETVSTVSYGPASEQTFDAYYDPAETGQPWVVVVHGGSWVAGAKSNEAATSGKLRAAGFVVFNVEYRKVSSYPGRPRVPWSEQLQDVLDATDYARAHASTFGIDPARGAIYGFSAGGHLAVSAGLTGNGSVRYGAIVSASGVLQPHRLGDVAFSDPDVGWAGDLPTDGNQILYGWAAAAMECGYQVTWADCSARWQAFKPETRISTDDPSVLMYQGTADESVPPQTPRSFGYWLSQKGVPNELVEGVNWNHTETLAMDGGWRQAKTISFLQAGTAS